jgi:lysophospholipid acyltransferase (LPLAT)-like uncharacterized protein
MDVKNKYSKTDKFLFFLARHFLPSFVRILGKTWRIKFYDPENFKYKKTIYAFWHRYLIPFGYAFRNRGVKALVSFSKEGEIVTRAIKKLGFDVIRGSSTEGASTALRKIVHELQNDGIVAITPDGPIGPAEKVKPGTVAAALVAGAEIIAISMEVKRTIALKTWDRLLIPLPFAKLKIFISKPMKFSKDMNIECIEEQIQNWLIKYSDK